MGNLMICFIVSCSLLAYGGAYSLLGNAETSDGAVLSSINRMRRGDDEIAALYRVSSENGQPWNDAINAIKADLVKVMKKLESLLFTYSESNTKAVRPTIKAKEVLGG